MTETEFRKKYPPLPPLPDPYRDERIHWERVGLWEWAILAFAIFYGVPQVLYATFHSCFR